jgi:hypothetical protein
MEMNKLDITIQLSRDLQHQLTSFQKARQIEVASDALQVILQEYFIRMGAQCSNEGTVSLQFLWINQTVMQQGAILAQLQQYVYELKQSIVHQTHTHRSKAPIHPLSAPISTQSDKEFWRAVELNLDIVEQGLTGVKLAERLGVDSSAISRKRNHSDFGRWTESRDPYQIAWEYKTSTSRFHPIQVSML